MARKEVIAEMTSNREAGKNKTYSVLIGQENNGDADAAMRTIQSTLFNQYLHVKTINLPYLE